MKMQKKCFKEIKFSQVFNFAFFVILFHSVNVCQKQPSKKSFEKFQQVKHDKI